MEDQVKLPQFKGETALIVVAGFDLAKFFIASDGRMRELSFFRVHPIYISADKPVEEIKKEDAFDKTIRNWRRKEFFSNLRDTVKVVIEHEKPSTIYIFGPKQTFRKVRKSVPFWWRGKIRIGIKKNLVNEHPFCFLEEIFSYNEKHEGKMPTDVRGHVSEIWTKRRPKKTKNHA